MKALFKYAFLTGFHIRWPAFAIIFVMNITFIILGSGTIPFALHILFITLGGLAVAVMMAANIGSDIIMGRRMYASADAYLQALTPVPRWKTLLANVIIMLAADIITMAFAIASIIWITFNFIGNNVWEIFLEMARTQDNYLFYTICGIFMMIAAYLLFVMIILFCAAMKKSILFKVPAASFLTFLLACGCFYAASLLQAVLLPISNVQIFGLSIILSPHTIAAYPILIVLTFLEAAGLFLITSKLIERKINI
ncbi:MAG: hypothetical protein FWB77_06530 [Treponema sp.]|nr:hypothetical protein [Treponema sp.]